MELCDRDGNEMASDFVILTKTKLPFETYKILCNLFEKYNFNTVSQFLEFLIYNYEFKDEQKARLKISEFGIDMLGKKGTFCNQEAVKERLPNDKDGNLIIGEIEW